MFRSKPIAPARRWWVIAAATVIALAPALSARQGDPVYHPLLSLGQEEFGAGPSAELLLGSDGAIYGTAAYGGEFDWGTIFRVNPDGTNFTVLVNLEHATMGALPYCKLLQETDGALYGTASSGGTFDGGTVFRLNADGSGFAVLVHLDPATTGASPFAGLLQGADGLLYGTTYSGGRFGYGTVFRVNTDGTGFTILKDLGSSSTGARRPHAGLLFGTDGDLYGTSSEGGTKAVGTVFKLKPDGSGFQILHHFDAAVTGRNPTAELIEGTDGLLYGTTLLGGSKNDGTLFKLSADGSGFSVVMNFDSSATGRNPAAGLLQGADGALYGTTEWGGTWGDGTVFKLDPDGTDFVVVEHLVSPLTGAHPNAGLIQAANGQFFGVTASGGTEYLLGPFGDGTLFSLGADGDGYQVLVDFSGSPKGAFPYARLSPGDDGWLYGAAMWGGSFGWGTVFKVNSVGTECSVLLNLDYYTTGAHPHAEVLHATDGALYGVSSYGGADGWGTIFQLKADGTEFKVLVDLDYFTTGAYPFGGLIEGLDGALYGTTSFGGRFDGGTVFRLNADGSGFTVLVDLDAASTGAGPFGRLLQGADGALYGTTFSGGAGGYGTVLKVGTDGSGVCVLEELDGATTGGSPSGDLLQGSDGAIYGTTNTGGSADAGTIFTLGTDGAGFKVLVHFDGVTMGAEPSAGLLQGSNGALYGTTNSGGQFDQGTAYQLNVDGTGFTVLVDFDGIATGSSASAGLVQGSDGALYGTTYSGGDHGKGVVYRLILDCTAAWSNYGAGFTGTLGIPTLTARSPPVLGSILDVDVANSAVISTLAYLLVGAEAAAIPLSKGPELLVVPSSTLVLALPVGGATISECLDDDPALCGVEVYVQTMMLDTGAAKGLSASPGLKLVLGY